MELDHSELPLRKHKKECSKVIDTKVDISRIMELFSEGSHLSELKKKKLDELNSFKDKFMN